MVYGCYKTKTYTRDFCDLEEEYKEMSAMIFNWVD